MSSLLRLESLRACEQLNPNCMLSLLLSAGFLAWWTWVWVDWNWLGIRAELALFSESFLFQSCPIPRELWDHGLIIWQYRGRMASSCMFLVFFFLTLQMSYLRHQDFVGFSEVENQDNFLQPCFLVFFNSFWLYSVILVKQDKNEILALFLMHHLSRELFQS